jgi:Cytochrome P450
MIGLHDEVQEKIFREMSEIFGDDTERVATFRDLNEMKYLERVLKETLRIYPSVPNISRKMNEDIEIGEGGFEIRQCFKSVEAEFMEKRTLHLSLHKFTNSTLTLKIHFRLDIVKFTSDFPLIYFFPLSDSRRVQNTERRVRSTSNLFHPSR